MVPAESNREVVSGMMNELSSVVPRFARGVFQRVIICLLHERTRIAMGFALLTTSAPHTQTLTRMYYKASRSNRHGYTPSSVPQLHSSASHKAISSRQGSTRLLSYL